MLVGASEGRGLWAPCLRGCCVERAAAAHPVAACCAAVWHTAIALSSRSLCALLRPASADHLLLSLAPPHPHTDISRPAHTALAAGCEGVAAINTITSVMGINLETLRPEPCGGWGAALLAWAPWQGSWRADPGNAAPWLASMLGPARLLHTLVLLQRCSLVDE